MKKYIFTLASLALALALVSCQKPEADAPNNGGGSTTGLNKVQWWGRTAEGLWTSTDKIGVYTSDDLNAAFSINYLPENASQQDRAYFEGEISADAVVYGAYYPYSADAGDNLTKIPVTIPSEVDYGMAPTRFDVAAFEEDADIKLTFKKKLTTVRLSFINLETSVIKDLKLEKIVLTAQRAMVGLYTADLTQPELPLSSVATENQLTFNLDGTTLTADLAIEAAVAATWKGSDKIDVSINNGAFATEVVLNEAAKEGGVVALKIDAIVFTPEIKLEWISPELGEAAVESQMRGNTVAVDQYGNAYAQVGRGSDKVYKLNASDGSIAWAYALGHSGDNNSSPAVEADGSVVYATGGASGTGRVAAINGSNGTAKWVFTSDKFFAVSSGEATTPAPNFNCSTPAIGSTNIYIGNAGTTGTVLAINKTNGTRVSYMSGDATGTGGPAGGVMSGVAISSANQVVCMSNYGIYTANKDLMDAPTTTHTTFGGYATWSQRIWHGWQYSTSRSGIACGKVNGNNVIWAAATEKTNSETYNLRVYWKAVSSDKNILQSYTKGEFGAEYNIQNVTAQDQGGIVIGKNGEAIVSLKGTPGSIYAINPDGTVAYTYTMVGGKDICGSCAVDNNGYVHMISDYDQNSGGCYYTIVKPDYQLKTCTVVANTKIQDLLSNINMGDSNQVRAWTSITMGNDGKMYMAVSSFRLEGSAWKDQRARVLCLSYQETTGPCTTSPWPQRAADCHHTGVQK